MFVTELYNTVHTSTSKIMNKKNVSKTVNLPFMTPDILILTCVNEVFQVSLCAFFYTVKTVISHRDTL